MRSAHTFFGLFALMIAATASRASAQEVEGKFQLALSTDLLTYENATINYDDTFEVKSSGVAWGIRESLLFELGYGVTDMIVIGGILQLGGTSQSVETDDDPDGGGDVSTLDVAVGPKIDVLFSPNEQVRPFVSAEVALVTSSTDAEGASVTSTTGFNLGARLGLHWFATESLSLMPAIAFGYTSGSGESEPDDSTASFEYDTESIAVGLMFGVSGWL